MKMIFLTGRLLFKDPKDTPYQDHIFLVKISLTSEYPIMPPKMYFKTKIFHPNIHFMTGWSMSWYHKNGMESNLDPLISMQSSSLFDAKSKRRLSFKLWCSKPDSFEIDRGI